MPLQGVVNLLHVGGTEVPPTDPVVVRAIATSDTKVQVFFDQTMRATDPGNVDDALNPANYDISTAVGVPRSPVSVAFVSGTPTVVELTLDGEMTDGAAYGVEVSNVVNMFGTVVSLAQDSASFTGQGTTPSIDSATASSSSEVVVVFDEAMRNNSALILAGNYVIGGYSSVVVLSIVRDSATQVTLTVEKTMAAGQTYNVTISNVQDAAYNPIVAPGNTDSFAGIGDHPKLLSNAIPVNSENVRIQFSKDVVSAEATDPTNYQITGGVLAIISILQETGDTYKITTGVQTTGLLYTIMVLDPGGPPPPDGIHDLTGNEVKAPDNVATFLGLGVSPPTIVIEPEDDARSIDCRASLRVNFYDAEVEFTGIDVSTIWVKVSYTDVYEVEQSFYCVKDGVIRPQASGSISGDPLTAAGITYSVLPRLGHWLPNTTYTVQAYAGDIEGSTNLVQQTFRTGNLACFEDLGLVPDAVDTAILQPLPYANLERLRSVLLRICTTSSDLNIQARSVLHAASITDLRTVLAQYIDFSLVTGIRLCDRMSVMSIHQALLRYLEFVPAAILEIPDISNEARQLLERYTQSKSSVYVVNAIAAMVVLAAMKQGS